MKRWMALFLAIVLLSLCSCGMSEEIEEIVASETKKKVTEPDAINETFGVAYASTESANPYTTSNILNEELAGLICEPLFSLSNSFEAIPILCSDYSYDGKKYTINIKSGVTFSDGSTLTAADVAYSFKEAMKEGSYYASRLSCVESVKAAAKGGYITVSLKYENSRLASLLTFPIVKNKTADKTLPTGTGMYAPSSDMKKLVARSGHHSGEKPLYNEITLTDVSNTDEQIFEFDMHNISLLSADPTGTSPQSPMSAAVMERVPTTQLHYIGFNFKNPALADKSTRLAIAKAIDIKNIAESDFALMGRPASLPMHPDSYVYPSEIASALVYDGNTPLATTEPLTILVNNENSAKLAACKRIAETLTRLGAPTTVSALPFEEYTQALKSGDFSLYYASVALGADFDITKLLSGSLNFGGFNDEELKALHSAYLSGDEAKDEFFTKFCEVIPFVPIMFKDTAVYMQEDFFESCTPTSENLYHDFSSWKLK